MCTSDVSKIYRQWTPKYPNLPRSKCGTIYYGAKCGERDSQVRTIYHPEGLRDSEIQWSLG